MAVAEWPETLVEATWARIRACKQSIDVLELPGFRFHRQDIAECKGKERRVTKGHVYVRCSLDKI
jgi:hypothetical protein